MKVLKVLGIIFLILILLVVVVGLVAPKEYAVERSVVIKAPTDYVYYFARQFKNFPKWEPWGKRDSTMAFKINGPDGEVNAQYTWEGDPKLTGKGEMKITGLKKNERIDYWIHFIEPMEDEATVSLIFEDQNANTRVTWGFYGKSPFPWNVMMLFMSMDKMLGPDLEEGLGNLKNVVEDRFRKISSYEIKQLPFGPKTYAVVKKDNVPFEKISEFFGQEFSRIMKIVKKKRARVVGTPTGLYFEWDELNMTADMAAAVPVNKPVEGDGVETVKIEKSRALLIDYYGPYDQSEMAHYAMAYHLYRTGLKMRAPVIEEYVTDPGKEKDPSKWLTRIIYLVD